jgi:hypothetical protein
MVATFATQSLPESPPPTGRVLGCVTFTYRFLLRYLARTLILALFLLSAITFSTEAIPNFQPDCEVSSARKATMVSTIKIVLPRTLLPLRRLKASTPRYVLPPFILPSTKTAPYIPPSRAPPALLF